MDPSFSPSQEESLAYPPIPSTRIHPLLWLFGGVIILGTLGFLGGVGYYVWHIRYGDTTALSKQFQKSIGSEFSRISGIDNEKTITPELIQSIIHSHNPIRGNATAPVTVVAFIDFECPFCQKSYGEMETMLATYGDAVRVIFKHLPLASIHPQAVPAAVAASCAHEQQAFWEYYHKLFSSYTLTPDIYTKYATDISLKTKRFEDCIASERTVSHIQQDIQDGITLGVRGTPTYFIGTKKIEGVVTASVWNSLIIDALQEQQ